MDGWKRRFRQENLVRLGSGLAAAVTLLFLACPHPALAKKIAAVSDPGTTDKLVVTLADFEVDARGQDAGGRWAIVDDPAVSTAIEHSPGGGSGSRSPLAIYKQRFLQDFDLSVRFRTVSGRAEQAGVALRLLSHEEYYLVRVDAHRGTVSFSHVMKSGADEIASVEADVFDDAWRALKIKADGERFTVWLEGRWLFTAYDKSLRSAGRVALWTRPDSDTRFEGFEVTPFPATETR
jgi:hypothetical protein